MIQPIQSSTTLLNDIESTQPGANEVAIWWLGQSGYAIKTASTLLYTDLYLSEHLTTKYANTQMPHNRMTESPLRGHEITNAEWVFASHKHSDHLDPGTLPDLFAASPQAKLILPTVLIDHAVSLGLERERLIPTRGEETITAGPLTVHSIPAAHPGLDYDEATGYVFLGFVIEIDGLTLYHSGDTLVYDTLADHLRPFDIDIAFLPINGTDEKRLAFGTPPNMNVEEAIGLAQAIKPRLVIPQHYDMFTFNTVDVQEFIQAADAVTLPYRALQCGEKFIWKRD